MLMQCTYNIEVTAKSRFTFMCDKVLNYKSLYLLTSDLWRV